MTDTNKAKELIAERDGLVADIARIDAEIAAIFTGTQPAKRKWTRRSADVIQLPEQEKSPA